MSGNHRLSAAPSRSRLCGARTAHDASEPTIIGSTPILVVRDHWCLDGFTLDEHGVYQWDGTTIERLPGIDPYEPGPDLSVLIETLAAEIPEP